MCPANEEARSSPSNRRKSKWSRVVLTLPLVAVVSGCKGEAKVQDEIVRPARSAGVGAAARGHARTYSGVARPRSESALGFRVPGKIVERTVNAGDRVEVGQVIARLDDTDLNLAEYAAKAAVAGARTRR